MAARKEQVWVIIQKREAESHTIHFWLFIGETRDFICGYFREGKVYTSASAIELLEKIISRFPKGIFKRLRADSGFFCLDFIKEIVKLGLEYHIAVPLQPWIQTLILQTRLWHEMEGYTGVSYVELDLPFKKWEGMRFVIIRTREYTRTFILLLQYGRPVYR